MNDLAGRKPTQSTEMIERLRVILERQQSQPVTREEASEMGETLLSFFETLGEDLTESVEEPTLVAPEADNG